MANCTDFCLSSLRFRILQDWSSTMTTAANKTCNFTGVTCKNFRVASIDLTNFDLNVDFESVSTYLVSSGKFGVSRAEERWSHRFGYFRSEISVRGIFEDNRSVAENRISDILSFGVSESFYKCHGLSGYRDRNFGFYDWALSSRSYRIQNQIRPGYYPISDGSKKFICVPIL